MKNKSLSPGHPRKHLCAGMTRRRFISTVGSAAALLPLAGMAGCSTGGSATSRMSCNNWGYMGKHDSRTFRRFSLTGTIESMAGIGYRAIEIVTIPGDFDLETGTEAIDEMHRALEANNMQISCLSPGGLGYSAVLYGHSAEKTIDDTAKWVDLAARIGAPVMRTQVVGMTKAGLMPTEEVVEALQPAISRSADYAASKGVKLAVETHGWSWARVPENIAALTKAVDSEYFGILLHTWPGEAERIVKLASNKVFHLHLCDSDMISLIHAHVHSPWLQDAGWTDENYAEMFRISPEEVQEAREYDPSKAGHYFMGDGEVDFKGVIQALRDAHYAGWWNYEGHLMEEPGPEEEARRAYEYLKPLLA